MFQERDLRCTESRKTKYQFWIVLVTSMCMYGCGAIITPNKSSDLTSLRKGQYRIDPRHTTLVFKVSHLGLSTFVGRFNEIDATLDFSPDNIGATRLSAVVKTASVDVNDSGLEDMLRGEKWFHVARFPEAIYSTSSVEILTGNTFQFTGNLVFMGVTTPVTLIAVFHGGADNLLTGQYTLGFSATGSLSRSRIGLGKYTSLVGDEVDLEVFAEFLREK